MLNSVLVYLNIRIAFGTDSYQKFILFNYTVIDNFQGIEISQMIGWKDNEKNNRNDYSSDYTY